jgi:YVTN family beta-propeller protein
MRRGFRIFNHARKSRIHRHALETQMKFAKSVGWFLEKAVSSKLVLAVPSLVLAMMGTLGAEQPGNILAPDSKGPSNKVVATIPCGFRPTDAVVTSDNQTVYVAGRYTNTVIVINATTNTVTTSIPVGNLPTGVAMTKDGSTLYVTNYSASSVSVINTSTNLVTATIPVDEEPYYLAVSPDGSSVYVATDGFVNEGAISVINTATNAVTEIPTQQNNIGIQVAFNPSGKEAYVSSYKGIKKQPDYLFEVDPATQKVTKMLNLASAGNVTLAVTPNGKSLYIAEEKEVAVLDIVENKVVKNIPLPKEFRFPFKGAITPDGKYFYLPVEIGQEVVMIDLTTNRYVEAFQVGAGAFPTSLTIAPNGHYAYVTDSSSPGALIVIDISGS